MAYEESITGHSINGEVIFSTGANWIDGFRLICDKRFESFEINPGYLDMSAILSVDEMKELHKEYDSEFDRGVHGKEMKFLDDALNVYGDKVYSRFVVHISEW